MSTDVTIVNEDMNENGEQVLRLTLGTIPAGQTEKLTLVKPALEISTPDRPKKPVVATCELRAEDPAGSVVWEMSWSEDEFLMIWQRTVGQSSSARRRMGSKAASRSPGASPRAIDPSAITWTASPDSEAPCA